MIGFIGLGIMGKPMVKNLLKAGVQVRVNDLVQSAVDEVAALGALPSTQAQIGADCDVVFTILPNGAIVQNVLFGENGVASTLRQGALVVDMSSVTPGESRACAERLARQDVAFLDAPVSGGEPGAINGTLSFMVGGDEETFQRAQPYFDIMGSSAIRIGCVGSGSITKLANQIIVNLGIAAVSEAFVLAAKAGADPEKVYQAIRGGLRGARREGADDVQPQFYPRRQDLHQPQGHQERDERRAHHERPAAADGAALRNHAEPDAARPCRQRPQRHCPLL